MKEIVQLGEHEALRMKAQDVPLKDIQSKKIQDIIADMKETLEKEPDGAALAAPQIGVPLRIFLLAEKVFGVDSSHKAASKDPHLVFINPVIIKRSGKKALMDEGCLSLRGKYGTIQRSTNVTVEAYDEHGKKFTRGAGGLLAQAFQHECDHFDGVLFCDGAKELWDVDMSEQKKN